MTRSLQIVPTLMPLGDRAMLVRFADRLARDANVAAIGFAQRLEARRLVGVDEIVPNLVSVLVRYDPRRIAYSALAGEIGLIDRSDMEIAASRTHAISVVYGGDHGPDLTEVAARLALGVQDFIEAHRAKPLDVLSVGFAPGFIYCGMHGSELTIPRRETIRQTVLPGSVLFAAGQTAIAATAIPTGWSVIGRTGFINFDPSDDPPTRIRAGDKVVFEAVS